MSNSLAPDQARRFVGPDLGPNCLPRLSADDTGRQRVKKKTNSRLTTGGVCVAVSINIGAKLPVTAEFCASLLKSGTRQT